MTYHLDIALTNETTERTFTAWVGPLDELWLTDEGTPDFGAIYRHAQRKYGRCQSSVYVDVEGGPPARVGWFFVSRQPFDDAPGTYLRGAWVTLAREVEPARPRVLERVEVA